MIAWSILNIITAIIPALIIVFKLTAYPDFFTPLERCGMGLTGTALVLRCAPILAKGAELPPTPFDDWATTLMGIGLTMYFIGRLLRRLHKSGAHG